MAPMMRDQKVKEITIYGKPPVGSTLEQVDAMFFKEEADIRKAAHESGVFSDFHSNFSKTGGTIQLEVAEKYQQLPIQDFHQTYSQLALKNQNSGFSFIPFPQNSVQSEQDIPQGMMFGGGGAETVEVRRRKQRGPWPKPPRS